MKRLLVALYCTVFAVFSTAAKAESGGDTLSIYVDADFTVTPAPGESIVLGLRAAFAETWAEENVNVVVRDHRGTTRRSFDTIQEAFADPTAIAAIGGMHSPPYFEHGRWINSSGLPLLLPWSAGGMLTRFAQGEDNWIFRLSVDDTKAGAYLAHTSLKIGCNRVSLATIDNPWGNGNADRITQIFEGQTNSIVERISLPNNAGMQVLHAATERIDLAKSDCVILVAGVVPGASFIEALAELDRSLTVISHWGLLGSRITEQLRPEAMDAVNLVVLGTCGLKKARKHVDLHKQALELASVIQGHTFLPETHPAPHGFYHAHDLGLLILQAIEIARESENWSASVHDRRRAFRDALYDIEEPVEGLLKFYERPFRMVSEQSPDGHEALGASDLCMTSFNEAGQLLPFEFE